MNPKVCIVVIGYNRIDSIMRNLNQLNLCDYPGDVDLYVSIDNSAVNSHVLNAVIEFQWIHGEKTVIPHEQRLGLKNHVLQCGDLINKKNYDGIIMLEDDIFVAPDFYNYVCQCIDYYNDIESIAGISLYKHDWNIDAKYPMIPLYDGYDVYFVRYAQSWGQAWSRRMWNEFRQWLLQNQEWDVEDYKVPTNVLNWGEKSWLKYNIRYCVVTGKYFVYPHQSLSTNFSDAGEHNAYQSVTMQRALSKAVGMRYRLCKPEDTASRYDAFFENISLGESLGYENLSVDLYGRKQTREKYLLSVQNLDYKIVKTYSLSLKPIEMNILMDVPGNGIFLYDTDVAERHEKKRRMQLLNYYWFPFDAVSVARYVVSLIYTKVNRKIRKK